MNFKERMILLRGNHESRNMTSHFTFRSECLGKYDVEIYDLIMESFDCLPLACIVDDKYIAMHGGISPELIEVSSYIHPRLIKSTKLTGFVKFLFKVSFGNIFF